MMDSDRLLTQDELARLRDALHLLADDGFPAAEFDQLREWAGKTRIRIACLDMVLSGELVVVGFEGKEPRFAASEVRRG